MSDSIPITVRRLVYLRDLLRELVGRDLKLRYKRSVMGIAWSLLNPLFQLLIFRFVFSVILPIKVPDFTVFMFIGLLGWGWFQSSLLAATGAITDNPPMIRLPGFPVPILPIATVTSNLVNFLLTLPVLLVFLLTTNHFPTASWLALPLLIGVQFVFTAAFAFLFAASHVPFRDTQHLLGVALTLGFYLAPTFYDPKVIPARYQLLYQLNPMVHILSGYRGIFLSGKLPPAGPIFLILIFSVAVLYLSYSLFVRTSYKFVEEL